ncbi:MAG TPA: tetratricopeptide repeat protein, partial [Candidatus Kapabacteria bacterium]|nr:tetratricopeptide repeat protein [Candidatus Kapabacteria bacterium]
MNRTFYRTLLLAVFTIFAATVYGQSVNEQINKSLKLIEIGNPKQALSDLQTLSSSNPKNADVMGALAIAMMQNGKPLGDVEPILAKAYDMERKSVLVRVGRGMLFNRQGKRDDASKEFAQAIKLDPKNIGTYLYTARFYHAADSMKAAEITLLQAQVVNEKDVRTYIGLAEHYEKQHAYDLAIEQYQDAKKIDPNDVTVMANLAGLYYRQRRWDDAINEWIKITKVDPTYSRAYFEIASIFFKARQYKNAAEYAEKYVQLAPNDVDGNWL